MQKIHKFHLKKLATVSFLLFFVFLSSGCGDSEYDEQAPINSNVKHIIDDPNYRPNENVENPQLAIGQILNIRLVYEINEKDEDNNEWYQVELRRNDSNWHDLVKIEGLARTKIRHWDDYTFSAKNFNWQIEQDSYGTNSLDGVYTLMISSSNGFTQNYQLNWKEGTWTNMMPARTFYVP